MTIIKHPPRASILWIAWILSGAGMLQRCEARKSYEHTVLGHMVYWLVMRTDGGQSGSCSSDGAAVRGNICRQHRRAAQDRVVPTAQRCAAVPRGSCWPDLANPGERHPGMCRVCHTRSLPRLTCSGLSRSAHACSSPARFPFHHGPCQDARCAGANVATIAPPLASSVIYLASAVSRAAKRLPCLVQAGACLRQRPPK